MRVLASIHLSTRNTYVFRCHVQEHRPDCERCWKVCNSAPTGLRRGALFVERCCNWTTARSVDVERGCNWATSRSVEVEWSCNWATSRSVVWSGAAATTALCKRLVANVQHTVRPARYIPAAADFHRANVLHGKLARPRATYKYAGSTDRCVCNSLCAYFTFNYGSERIG